MDDVDDDDDDDDDGNDDVLGKFSKIHTRLTLDSNDADSQHAYGDPASYAPTKYDQCAPARVGQTHF